MTSRSRRSVAVFVLAAGVLGAQEYRATITGTVTDPSGAAMPEAKVTATNIETAVTSSTVTAADGDYVIPFLAPGNYTLRVEKTGFKTMDRGPFELRVNDRTRMDVGLEIGAASDRVTVTAEAPLLETDTSSRGQVVDEKAIADMPLNGHNPYTLMTMGGSGVNYGGSLLYFRPIDQGAIGDFLVNGGQYGLNTYQVDGAPNDSSVTGSELAYVPPVEATQEFKIQTNIYDAQYGRTSGGVINLSIKPGTNSFHGAAYEYLRRTFMDANPFSQNAAGAPRAQHPIDQYGWELDGPVRIPKIYNGKDRTFFMFTQERYREFVPQPATETVPTPLQRTGDFSQTYKGATQLYTIYDPQTVSLNPNYNPALPLTVTNSQYVQQPFPGNVVPTTRFNPIALNVLSLIPPPNQPGQAYTALNNYYGANVGEHDDFGNLVARMDQIVNDKWRVFARAYRSFRDGGRIDYNGWGTAATSIIHAERFVDGALFDATDTLSAHTILDMHVSYSFYENPSIYKPISITALGFPSTLIDELPINNKFPIMNFTNYTSTGQNESAINPEDVYTGAATLTHIVGSHSMKFGAEYRGYQTANASRSNGMGNYSFDVNWTRHTPDYADPNSGNAIATFLLGDISSGSVTVNTATLYSYHYPVVYYQDDWKLTRRLTLNYGLRWEYQSPAVERHNQAVGPLDLTAPFPVAVPGMPNLMGGLTFAGVNGVTRGAFNPDRGNIQPRFGIAYRILNKHPLVFRGGFGRLFIPVQNSDPTTNFSRTTSVLTSTSSYNPIGALSNPFPTGLLEPLGSSLGLATNAGLSISAIDPNSKIPYVWQFSGGFEYEVRPGLLAEATYSGSRTYQLAVTQNLNALTLAQLNQGSAYLNKLVPNPFYNIPAFAGTSLGTNATVAQSALITPHPQFSGVSMTSVPIGLNWYNSVQFKLEKRFKHGLQFLASYTISKNLQASSYLNAQDTQLARALVAYDRPQYFVLSGSYELPFGPKKDVLNHGKISKIVGGWELNLSFTARSGVPIAFNSGYYLECNPKLPNPTTAEWFNTSSACWVQRPANTLVTMPLRSGNIRAPYAPQMDSNLFRIFNLGERRRFELRFSAFNTFNTPIWPSPNTSPSSPLFGTVTLSQSNLPRNAEIGFRYAF